ncbi:MAG: sigma-70 family RNA polymerase sigma factor [Acidobacteria bacterium]|nr:sigma-70 family RNA polymerase sigma factor [Acidobacteriota bacterium]
MFADVKVLGLPVLMSAISSTSKLLLSAATAGEVSAAAVAPLDEVLTDHRLLEATKEGDEAAFAELVRRYRNQITNYVYRMTNDYETAVDLAQETFMRVYAAADRYQTTYAFSTYIYRIATNLAISELRRRKRRRLVSLTGFFQSHDSPGEVAELDLRDLNPLQDVTLAEDERRSAVARAIATLPEKYRAPLVLRDVEERSYEEIATILQMSEGTVKSRINRARSFLRDKLQAYL